MLAIVDKSKLDSVKNVLDKWGVPFAVIGKVTGDGMVRVKDGDKLEAEVPAKALAEGPVYTREEKKPAYLAEVNKLDLSSVPQPKDLNDVLLKLLSHPTIASKEWVFKKGDPKLGKTIPVGPGSDAGVMAVPGSKKGVAATTDCNGSYVYLDPFFGSAIAVAESARNLVCAGAKPLAITDGINFGNPKNPEIYWQFHQAVLGISEACKKLNTPVVSGNVSFNNENPKGSVDPTPVIGMVGVIEDAGKAITQSFKAAGDVILLVGETHEEIGGSQYLQTIHDQKKGPLPKLDLDLEKRVQDTVLEAIQKGLVASAHDCSEGGLAVALAECCITDAKDQLGAEVLLDGAKIRPDALLFGETQSRIIISAKPTNAAEIEKLCRKNKVPVSRLGTVGKDTLKIEGLIDLKTSEMDKAWRGSIPNALG
jgi:phosphoribosylformylglycinamidine synthase